MSGSIVPPHDKFRRRSAIIPPAATVDDFERVPRAIGALVAFRRGTEQLTRARGVADGEAALVPLQVHQQDRILGRGRDERNDATRLARLRQFDDWGWARHSRCSPAVCRPAERR